MILLFLLWIILNGRFTLDSGMLQIVVTGLILVIAVAFFSKKVLGYTVAAELRFWKKLPLLLAYIALLVSEVIKSSFKMALLILRNKPYSPEVIKINPPLKKEFTRVILANSITLTPGTITAELNDNGYVIHCIDPSFAEGIEDCAFVKLLERIEK